MENESNSKIEELEEKLDAVGVGFLKQQKDIKKLKKKQARKMTAMKFVGVVFVYRSFVSGNFKSGKRCFA